MLNKLLKRCMPWMDKGRWYKFSFDYDATDHTYSNVKIDPSLTFENSASGAVPVFDIHANGRVKILGNGFFNVSDIGEGQEASTGQDVFSLTGGTPRYRIDSTNGVGWRVALTSYSPSAHYDFYFWANIEVI